MAFKILTKNGIDNTNIDGARSNYFSAGMRDGIFKGSLNEGRFVSLTSNAITLDTGVFMIGGHIVINDEAWTQTFSAPPVTNTRYALVAQIVVDNSSNVTFSLIVQLASTALVKNNLFATENGAGTYQVEIGRFTLTTSGLVEDVVRTLDLITGGSSGMGEHFIVGTITTVMLDAGMDANVTAEDIYDANGNYQQTNFLFEIPETAGTVVKVNNVEQANLDFISDPQTQLNNKVDKETGKGLSTNDYTTDEKEKLAGIEAQANKTVVDDALSNSSENPVQNKAVKSALDNKADLTNASQVITLGGLKDGNNANYKAALPNTTSWTADKILAITDDIPATGSVQTATPNSNVIGNGFCQYQKYGKLVWVYIYDLIIKSGTAAHNALIFSGLPTPSSEFVFFIQDNLNKDNYAIRVKLNSSGEIKTNYSEAASFGDNGNYHNIVFTYITSEN